MKYGNKYGYLIFILMILMMPKNVLAMSEDYEYINIGAIINNVSNNSLSVIIMGMIAIILVLVGTTLFSSRK